MRIPSDLPPDPSPRRRHRARWWIIGLVVVLIVLLVSLRSLAGLYTDSLWFSSVGYHNVFSTLLVTKLGLFGVFGAIFFAVLWVNLVVCDRIAGHDIVLAQEDELVRRYQQYVRPYAGRIYVALAFVLALIGASGTIGQWNNWILFRHGGSFGVTDPQFGKDIGFYVFKLPFLTFVVDWTLAILIVTLAVVLVFHYFNGGIQPQRGIPRVRAPVKAHISVLLALIALDKAAGYVLQRWSLVNSQDGYVNGAGYTDVHARLPAELLLVFVSIFAAGILLFNIRRQGWTLPVLAIGIWAFVALVVGIIYPALLQALKVTPAQSSLEAPYIQRNISATRDAYGLTNVKVHQFSGTTNITPSDTVLATPTIANIRQWDPDPTISLQTFQRLQSIRSYYIFPSVAVDRYVVKAQSSQVLTPVLIGVRDISSSNLPSQSWVNTHLQYTHGNGAAVSLANQTNNNSAVYGVAQVPPQSSNGLPQITQAGVYFGQGLTGYVVANTKQLEVDYQRSDNSIVESHYSGPNATGGVQMSSIFTRAAFALRLGDFNLLISSQITSKSRLMFVRDPVAMAQKAAPFLSFDHAPYAVINHGHIDWVVDGYTTTSNYAYSQNANSQQVAIGSTLPSSYNYVRNSVKVVVDAYSGQMTFYANDPSDPILQAYEAAFPHMFTPLSKMNPELQAHLRYPSDIFSIQSAIYGRYHLLNPQNFYSASNAWQLSPTAGAGPQSQALLAQNAFNAQGQLISTTPARMAPQYQVYSLPGSNPQDQVFNVSDGFVPASQTSNANASQNFNLTAWMVGQTNPGHRGQLDIYETPQGTSGPANADAEISANKTVSSDISLLDQHGSEVLLGETLMVPIGNAMVYLRPLYVSPTTNPQPQLQYVVAVLGKQVQIDTSLTAVLGDLLQTTVSLPSGGSSAGTVPTAVQGFLQAAQTDYQNALNALKTGNFATFGTDLQMMAQEISQAQSVIQQAAPGSTPTTTTTTTLPKVGRKSKTGSTTTTTTSSSTTTSTTSTTSGGGGTTPTVASAAGRRTG